MVLFLCGLVLGVTVGLFGAVELNGRNRFECPIGKCGWCCGHKDDLED